MAAAVRAAAKKARWVELRLDYLLSLREIERLLELLSRKDLGRNDLIFTLRRQNAGGRFSGTVAEQLAVLNRAARLNQWIDVEIEMIDATGSEGVRAFHRAGAGVIASYHNFNETPSDLEPIVRRLKSTRADILKIATQCNSLDDAGRLLALQEKLARRKISSIVLGMGPAGVATRILGPSRGSVLTYAPLEETKSSAPGQLTFEDLQQRYRIQQINRTTKIYGIIGYPLGHSLSPVLYNSAFSILKMNAVHLRLESESLGDFRGWTKQLGISGLSVTLPYKAQVTTFLNGMDPLARFVGAVNTVHLRERRWEGYNTDVTGIQKALQKLDFPLQKSDVLLLGAGGAAQAAAAFLNSQNARVFVCNRTMASAERLAQRFRLRLLRPEELPGRSFHLVVNATAVGMWPYQDRSPIDLKTIRTKAVFDMVYKPIETRLLAEARRRKIQTISGLEMFLAQAVAQFKILTGRALPDSAIRLVQQSLRRSRHP